MSPQVGLRVFGGFELSRDAVLTPLRSSRVEALLAYLVAYEGRPCFRTTLAEALWPGREQNAAHQNLRQALLTLRHTLGDIAEEAVEANRRYVRLLPRAIDSDLALFRGFLSTGDLEAAVAAYEGPFSPTLDDAWALEVRADLARAHLQALLELSDTLRAGDPARALEYAERAVREEPFHDGARARKIRALRALGEEARALLEFEAYEAYLEDELGLRPARIVEEALSDAAPTPPSPPPTAPTEIGTAIEVLLEGDRPEAGIRLAISLTPYWVQTGQAAAGLARLDQTFSRWDGARDSELLGQTGLAAATLALRAGLNDRAQVEALFALDRLSRPDERASALICLAMCRNRGRAWHEGRRFALAALRVIRGHGRASLESEAWAHLANAHVYGGAPDRGIARARRAFSLATASRLSRSMAGLVLAHGYAQKGERPAGIAALVEAQAAIASLKTPEASARRASIARIFEELGERDRAEAGYLGAVAEFRTYQDLWNLAIALTYLGDFMTATERPTEAIPLHEEALVIRERTGDRVGYATSLRGLGRARLARGEAKAAREALRESVRVYTETEATPGAASSLLALSLAERELGRPELAYRLAARAYGLFQGMSAAVLTTIGPDSAELIPTAKALICELAP